VILNAAKVEGLRSGETPALWRGHLDQILPKRRKKRDVKHHPTLPYTEHPKRARMVCTEIGQQPVRSDGLSSPSKRTTQGQSPLQMR
jgi:hypothetical protein